MTHETKPSPHISDVAMWHKLSGHPDNVTDEGEIIDGDEGRRLRSAKALLRGEIAHLRGADQPISVRGMARLAASYLIAGDVETARRYVIMARERLSNQSPEETT